MDAPTSEAPQYRLSTGVCPTHYELTVRTDLESLKFDGFVSIDLDVNENTSKFDFHLSSLNLGSVSLSANLLHVQQVDVTMAFDEKAERVILLMDTLLLAGSKAQLHIAFHGELTDGLMGYYRSAYKVNGTDKYYSLTQLAPTAARRAFPCWDEPALKATFALTMISREKTTNLSNMNVISEHIHAATEVNRERNTALSKWLSTLMLDAVGEDSAARRDQWKITKFATTPLMSTYLVAFANGDFEHLESSYTSPLSGKTRPLRIYAIAEHIKHAQYALDITAKVLPLYEQTFDIEYPLPKLDTLIADDFDLSAMENWGLIIGRADGYCIDPERPSLEVKKRITMTQTHEVAHQWFGNIATMEWWDNLYLNEGFATLMGEVLIPNKLYPEWKVNTAFINKHITQAFSLDAKLSSHPIEAECPDAEKANQLFDDLSYSKAASVLRMLMSYVGEDKFVRGVSIYLKKHLYASTVSQDLWDGISEAAGIDVGDMMRSWVGKIGFPVLIVNETTDGLNIRQDRFLETGLAEPRDNETIWTLPLRLLTVGHDGKPSIDSSLVLRQREMSLPLDMSKPFKLNAGATGFYHVLYTPERFAQIFDEAVKGDGLLTADDRIEIANTVGALAKAGLIPTSTMLTLAVKLRNETRNEVWQKIMSTLSQISLVWFENTQVQDRLDVLRRSLAAPLVRRLGFEYPEDEDAGTTELRNLAINVAAVADDPSVVAELRGRFDHFMKTGDDSRIPPNLLMTIYKTAVRHGGREEFEKMKQIHENPKVPIQINASISAMASHPDPAYTLEMFKYAMEKARSSDWMVFFAACHVNKNRRVGNQFYKDNYDTLYERCEGSLTFSFFTRFAFSSLASEKDHEDAVAFFKDKETSKFALVLQQTLDSMASNEAWIKRSNADVEKWLKEWQA